MFFSEYILLYLLLNIRYFGKCESNCVKSTKSRENVIMCSQISFCLKKTFLFVIHIIVLK